MTATIVTPTTTRTLHLVDLENLCANPVAPAPVVRQVLDDYLRIARWRSGDHVRIAVNGGMLLRIGWDLPVPANLHAVKGEDAADVMLLAHEPPELVVRRFGRLVIGSGDHCFAPRARAARDLGVAVTVVSRPRSLARVLTGEGFAIRLLEPTPTPLVLAA
jgi:hypothetical protein